MSKATATPAGPAVCPHQAGAAAPAVRPPADRFMRRLLLISDRPNRTSEEQVYSLFSTSIMVSATRCILSYVIFPIFAPAIGAATGVGPAIGLVIGVVALVFDVFSIRRFWQTDHRWRWPMTVIYAAVIVLVSVLLVGDITHLIERFTS